MYSARRLSIVIPCLNEEEAIPHVLSRYRETRGLLREKGISDVEMIVVDDGSRDRSLELLRQMKDVVLVQNKSTEGYGAALKRGFEKASGDLIAFYDMDNTYDPVELGRMIDVLDSERAGVVCGDRLTRCTKMPLTRKVGNALFVAVVNALYRQKVQDSCTGLRLFRSAHKARFCDLGIDNLNYSLAMTIYCLSHDIPLREIPISYDKRIGRSKLKVLIDGPRFLFTIFVYWARYERHLLAKRLANWLV